jgi:hypothetical protein
MRWIRTAWTDERLDGLNGRVDELSSRVDRLSDRMDAGFARVDAELRAVTSRIDGVQQTMLRGFMGTWVAMLTSFIALAGLIISHG